ncbi:hypothetical protein GJR96_04100 [Haloferax sp. MBLA0076]|uniref:Uncharacterized protein n=1 Tax=Haloferax litoreum TaxID=2666140 RepID=A0A6A8GE25_9EURY|nr:MULTISPECIES: hypothetical protein [Haloferax]KAB1192663.1 hypothetical protein Hfx1148_04090 [Haloferax sp. CBA1148]MRX21139.1 hypothetical protein [Haloferax litoreum]
MANHDTKTELSRRRVLKAAGTTAVVGGFAVGSAAATKDNGNGPPDKAACEPPYYHDSDVDATNVGDAPQPTIRVDNKLDCPLKIKLLSNGGSFDGRVVTVGPRHSGYKGKDDGYPNQTGKLVKLPESDCGTSITGLKAKLPQAKSYSAVKNFGTATIGGEGCNGNG